MPRQPGRSSWLLGCVLLAGCTTAPEPQPIQPTTASQSPPAPQTTTLSPPAAPTVSPAPAPTETATLTPAFQELEASLELFSREKLEEGASAVLIKAKIGQQEWTLAEGVRSREARLPVQPGDRFPVGGQYRSFLAVSVMKLVEEGRLGLTDPVSTYPPGTFTAGTRLTILDLLGDAGDLRADVGDAAGPEAYSLLGQVVEQLRGAPLEAVLRSDVLTPLDLRSTALLETRAVPEDLIHGYVHVEGDTVDVTGTAVPNGDPARLVSTVEDISAFQAALLRGQLLTPASLITMKGTIFAENGLGLGLDHWDDRCTNGLYYGSAGDIPGYGSVSLSSADGNRQLSIFLAYPPQPVSSQPSALALEMTGVAQVALNSACRFQFR